MTITHLGLWIDAMNHFVRWNVIEMFENIDDCYNTWIIIYDDVLNQHCPMKKMRVSTKNQHQRWYNDEVDAARLARDTAFKTAIQTNTDTD